MFMLVCIRSGNDDSLLLRVRFHACCFRADPVAAAVAIALRNPIFR